MTSLPASAHPFTFGNVVEGGREFPLVGLTSPGSRSVVITAGFHGDEKAGPLTLLEHASEIVSYAAERDVALAIYPCVNPSGFEAHTRYNVTGEHPNNDFLRYETTPGTWRGELREGEDFLRVTPAGDDVPKETAALARALDALPQPHAALDLHQDNFIHGSLFYAYVFGDRAAIVARELTKIHEEFVRGKLSELAATFDTNQKPRGEMVLIIGADNSRSGKDHRELPANSLVDRVSELEKEGLDSKAALKRAARELGLKRDEAYRLMLDQKNRRNK